MNKKIISITSLVMILLASINVCYASDIKTLEKEYTVDYKNADEFYNSIDKAIFENKIGYELENIDRTDNLKSLTKEKEIVETLETSTDNLEKVISMFNETKDSEEDGYTGILTRDNSSLKISINNSYQEEYKVYLQKTYKNVPSNELNDIPKTIKNNGITYYLVNPVWTISETTKVSDSDVPLKYNGTMYYEGVKSKTIVTSYLATIKYSGVLEMQVPDTTTFRVAYKEVKDYTGIINTILATSGIFLLSGIIIFHIRNVKIYNLQNGEYKLIKKIHLNKNKMLIDLTPTNLQIRSYKIVLSKSLFRSIKGKNIKLKYFDKVINSDVDNKEFEVIM